MAVVEVDGKCVKSLMGDLVQNTDPDWSPREVCSFFKSFLVGEMTSWSMSRNRIGLNFDISSTPFVDRWTDS